MAKMQPPLQGEGAGVGVYRQSEREGEVRPASAAEADGGEGERCEAARRLKAGPRVHGLLQRPTRPSLENK